MSYAPGRLSGIDWGNVFNTGVTLIGSAAGGGGGGGGGSTSTAFAHGDPYLPNGDRRWIAYEAKSGQGRLPYPSRCAGVVSAAVGVRAMQNAPDNVVAQVVQQLQAEYTQNGGANMPTVAELRDPSLPADKWISLVLGGDDCRFDRSKSLPAFFASIVSTYGSGGAQVPTVTSLPAITPVIGSTGGGGQWGGSAGVPTTTLAPSGIPWWEAIYTGVGVATGQVPGGGQQASGPIYVAPPASPLGASMPLLLAAGLAVALLVRK